MSGAFNLYMLPRRGCHCSGTGWVIMDDAHLRFPEGGAVAEPCPMCTLGLQHSSEVVTGVDLIPSVQTKEPSLLSSTKRDRPIPRNGWRNRDGRFIEVPDYYHGVAVDRLTWLNGLTVYDRYECATLGCYAWVDAPRGVCSRCAPSASRVIPSLGSIMQAHRLKARGDERSLFDLAVAVQQRIVERHAGVVEAGREAARQEQAVREAWQETSKESEVVA